MSSAKEIVAHLNTRYGHVHVCICKIYIEIVSDTLGHLTHTSLVHVTLLPNICNSGHYHKSLDLIGISNLIHVNYQKKLQSTIIKK